MRNIFFAVCLVFIFNSNLVYGDEAMDFEIIYNGVLESKHYWSSLLEEYHFTIDYSDILNMRWNGRFYYGVDTTIAKDGDNWSLSIIRETEIRLEAFSVSFKYENNKFYYIDYDFKLIGLHN